MKKLKILFLACLAIVATQAKAQDHPFPEAEPLPALHVEGRWLVDDSGNRVVLHGVMDTPNAWFNGGRWGWSYDDEGLTRCLDYFEKMLTSLEIANCDIFRLHLDPAWTNDKDFLYPGARGEGQGARGEADISHFNPDRLKDYMQRLYVPIAMKALAHGQYVVMRPPGVCPPFLKVGDYYQKYLMEVWDIVSRNEFVRSNPGLVSIELANEPINIRGKEQGARGDEQRAEGKEQGAGGEEQGAGGKEQGARSENDPKALHDYFQPIVDMIRANGFKGIIWVPGTGFQSNYADYAVHPIEGDNIGYAVHVYPGWYGCDDRKVDRDADIEKSKREFIAQFKKQVPVVETNPIFVSEVDWSPIKEPREFDKVNEWGDSIYRNLGTWATASTSKWGVCYKAVLDHFGNISMTLTHPHDYLDLDKMVKDPLHPVPAFDGNPEACSGACWQWYETWKGEKLKRLKSEKVKGLKGENGKSEKVKSLKGEERTFTNPIVRADFPDPDVIRVGNTYYMVSTTMYHFPGATILKSPDLVHWEYCAQPLKALTDEDQYYLRDGKNAYARGMWASSIKYHDGKFYLLINGNDHRAWLLTTTDPEGEWTVRRLSRNYYDPGLLFDGGKVYIVCGINHLVMCELDGDFNLLREQEVVVREGSGLEGCHLYRIGDYYYIYATYGGWPSGQTVFRSKDIFGPYEERVLVEKWYDQKPNTIHQGALVDDTSGQWWTVMQEDLGALGRFPNLLPVRWEKGWPIVGARGKEQGARPYASFQDCIPCPAKLSNGKWINGKCLNGSDDFSQQTLGMQWQWNHYPADGAWSLTERPGWLRLKTTGIAEDLHQAQGMLTQRIFADPDRASTAIIRLDVSHLKEGDCAGICIFQDPYAYICVEALPPAPLRGERSNVRLSYQLVWRQDKVRDAGRDFQAQECRQKLTFPPSPRRGAGGEAVFLRASIRYGENKARFQYSLDGTTWEPFGGETQQSFNLSVFVGSRFGIFCYATKQQGGYADFDWISTEP